MVQPPPAPQPAPGSYAARLRSDQDLAPRTAAAEEKITAESPLLDERRISTGATVSGAELSRIPTQGQASRPAAQAGAVAANEAVAKQAAAARDQAPAGGDAGAAGAPGAPLLAETVPAPEPAPARALPPSTGGLAEPDDQPNGVFLKSNGVDPFVDSEDDRHSTFGLDVDTGSYNAVRRYLNAGQLPPVEAVRVEELVNAFDYGDVPPAKNGVALIAEAAPDPWAPSDRYLLARFVVTIGQESRAQVEVDPRVVSRWRLLGYENRDVADERVRDDTFDAGENGGGHAVTALYELELRPDAPPNATLAVLHLRSRPAGGGKFQEIRQPLRRSTVAKSWESASRGFRLATVVGRFAEILHGSYWAKEGAHGDDLAELSRRAAQVSEDWPRQERVAELVSLIGRARDLRRGP